MVQMIVRKPLGSRMMMFARLAAVRELQSAAGEELRRRRTLLPPPTGMISVLRLSGVGVQGRGWFVRAATIGSGLLSLYRVLREESCDHENIY